MDQQSIIRRLQNFYDSYFFTGVNLLNIGLLRIILVALSVDNALTHLGPFQDAALTDLHHRSLLTDLLAQTVFFRADASVLTIIFIISAAGALFGIFTRPSLFVFGLFMIFLTGFRTSLGVFDHSNSLVTQVILILAFIPGSTNLSVDRLIRWLQKYRKGLKPSFKEAFSRPLDHIWGVRLLLMLLACVYFTAGFSKIRYGGLEWLDGKTLTHYLDGSAAPSSDYMPPMFLSDANVSPAEQWKDGFGLYAYSYGNRQGNLLAVKAGKTLAAAPMVIMALSVMTVLFELSSFCLLMGRWPRTIYLLGAIFLHTSIGFFMGLTFIQFRIICFLLIDWQWLYRHLEGLIRRKTVLQPGVQADSEPAELAAG